MNACAAVHAAARKRRCEPEENGQRQRNNGKSKATNAHSNSQRIKHFQSKSKKSQIESNLRIESKPMKTFLSAVLLVALVAGAVATITSRSTALRADQQLHASPRVEKGEMMLHDSEATGTVEPEQVARFA